MDRFGDLAGVGAAPSYASFSAGSSYSSLAPSSSALNSGDDALFSSAPTSSSAHTHPISLPSTRLEEDAPFLPLLASSTPDLGAAQAAFDIVAARGLLQERAGRRLRAQAAGASSSSSSSSSFPPDAGLPLPLCGLGCALDPSFATDASVSARRQERQLWSLVRRLWGSYMPAEMARAGRRRTAAAASSSSTPLPAAIPADVHAHDHDVERTLEAEDSEYALLVELRAWLEAGAAEDVAVVVRDELRSAATPDTAAAFAMAGAGDGADDVPPDLLPRVGMWGETARQRSCAALDPDALTRPPGGENDAVVARHPGLFAHAPSAAAGSGLSKQDAENELALYSGVWQLLRAGDMPSAAVYAAKRGQPWVGAVLYSGVSFRDELVRGEGEMEGGEGEGLDELVRRGNPFPESFAHAVADLTSHGGRPAASSSSSDSFRSAVLLAAAGTTAPLAADRTVCRTAEDTLWALAASACRKRAAAAAAAMRAAQAAVGPDLLPREAPASAPFAVPAFGPFGSDADASSSSAAAAAAADGPTVERVFAAAQALRDAAPALASPFARIARALFHLARRIGSPVAAELQTAGAKVVAALAEVLPLLPREYRDAVAANRGGPGAGCFSPLTADALQATQRHPLPDAVLPLLRFAAHCGVLVRDHLLLARAGAMGAALDAPTSAVVDDLLYAYARHMSSVRPAEAARALAHLLAACARIQSEDRAVRALLAFFFSAAAGGGVVGGLLHQPSASVRPVPAAPHAISLLGGDQNPVAARALALAASAERHAVYLRILLDGPTVLELVAKARRTAAGAADPAAVATATAAAPPRVGPVDALQALGISAPLMTEQLHSVLRLSLYDYARASAVDRLVAAALTPSPAYALDALVAANALSAVLCVEAGLLDDGAADEAVGGGGPGHVHVKVGRADAATVRSALSTLLVLWPVPADAVVAPSPQAAAFGAAPSASSVVPLSVFSLASGGLSAAAFAAASPHRSPADARAAYAEAESWCRLADVVRQMDAWEREGLREEGGGVEVGGGASAALGASSSSRRGFTSASASASSTTTDFLAATLGSGAAVRDSSAAALLGAEQVAAKCAAALRRDPVVAPGPGRADPSSLPRGWVRGSTTIPVLLPAVDPPVTDLARLVPEPVDPREGGRLQAGARATLLATAVHVRLRAARAVEARLQRLRQQQQQQPGVGGGGRADVERELDGLVAEARRRAEAALGELGGLVGSAAGVEKVRRGAVV
jgi:hypothetical protein